MRRLHPPAYAPGDIKTSSVYGAPATAAHDPQVLPSVGLALRRTGVEAAALLVVEVEEKVHSALRQVELAHPVRGLDYPCVVVGVVVGVLLFFRSGTEVAVLQEPVLAYPAQEATGSPRHATDHEGRRDLVVLDDALFGVAEAAVIVSLPKQVLAAFVPRFLESVHFR